MKIKVLASAVADLHAGRLFYEGQAKGIGAYFFDSLFSAIDSLARYAGIHAKVYGYYRMLSKRFPYAIYYALEEDTVIVWRVLDLRQDPARIRLALRKGLSAG
jgi:plasmid stabilization system protein ParE